MNDFIPHIGQFIEIPENIQLGTRPPRGKETPALRRIAPGRHAEIKMRRELALQNAPHPLQDILAG